MPSNKARRQRKAAHREELAATIAARKAEQTSSLIGTCSPDCPVLEADSPTPETPAEPGPDTPADCVRCAASVEQLIDIKADLNQLSKEINQRDENTTKLEERYKKVVEENKRLKEKIEVLKVDKQRYKTKYREIYHAKKGRGGGISD